MRPREIRGHAQSDKARASQSKPELRIFKRKYKGNQNTEFPNSFPSSYLFRNNCPKDSHISTKSRSSQKAHGLRDFSKMFNYHALSVISTAKFC